MLLRCLKINPNERPNIHTLTDDATAVPLELPALIYIDQPDLIVQHFSDSTKRLYRLYFSKLKIRDEIFSYASYLYNRYSMTLIEKNQKFLHLPANILLGCLCIALKILQHENLEIDPLLQNLNDSDDLIIHIADTLHCKLL